MDLGEKQNTIIKGKKKGKLKNSSNISMEMSTLTEARHNSK